MLLYYERGDSYIETFYIEFRKGSAWTSFNLSTLFQNLTDSILIVITTVTEH